MMKRLSLTALIVFMFCTGCTTPQAPLRAGPPSSYQHRQSSEGVTVAVSPMTNPEEVMRWFGKNILAAGVLPILVVVQNENSPVSVIVGKEHIFFRGSDSANLQTSTKAKVGDPNPWLVAMLVTGVVGGRTAANEQIAQYNLGQREFSRQTLSRGGQAEGFVYYVVPKGSTPPKSLSVKVEAVKAGGGTPVSLQFEVPITH